jgi:hypothetical protein
MSFSDGFGCRTCRNEYLNCSEPVESTQYIGRRKKLIVSLRTTYSESTHKYSKGVHAFFMEQRYFSLNLFNLCWC